MRGADDLAEAGASKAYEIEAKCPLLWSCQVLEGNVGASHPFRGPDPTLLVLLFQSSFDSGQRPERIACQTAFAGSALHGVPFLYQLLFDAIAHPKGRRRHFTSW